MAYQPDQCWTLERVPSEGPPFLLQNAKEVVTFGRKQTNDRRCQGPNVSRDHLKFVRSGSGVDWEGVRWSVVDLGGMNGTFVNRNVIPSMIPYGLNEEDLVGVGSPEPASSVTFDTNRDGTRTRKETFVFRLKAPAAFLRNQNHDGQEDAVDLEDDAPTPPPADVVEEVDEVVVPLSNLPDLVLHKPKPSPAQEGNDAVAGEVKVKFGQGLAVVPPAASASPEVITLDSEDDEKESSAPVDVKLEINSIDIDSPNSVDNTSGGQGSKSAINQVDDSSSVSTIVHSTKNPEKSDSDRIRSGVRDKSGGVAVTGHKLSPRPVSKRSVSSSDDESQRVRNVKKRKRIRMLFDSDSDDSEQVAKQKHKNKTATARTQSSQSSSCALERLLSSAPKPRPMDVKVARLKMPEGPVVGAKVEESGLSWVKVGREEFVRVRRVWKGLEEDGSQGTPLLATFEDVSEDEILPQLLNDLSPISSENEFGEEEEFAKGSVVSHKSCKTAPRNKRKLKKTRSRKDKFKGESGLSEEESPNDNINSDDITINFPTSKIGKGNKIDPKPVNESNPRFNLSLGRSVLPCGIGSENFTNSQSVSSILQASSANKSSSASEEPDPTPPTVSSVAKLTPEMRVKWTNLGKSPSSEVKKNVDEMNSRPHDSSKKGSVSPNIPINTESDHSSKDTTVEIKTEPGTNFVLFSRHLDTSEAGDLNYSQQEEVIEIQSSEDEDEMYVQSQQSMSQSMLTNTADDFVPNFDLESEFSDLDLDVDDLLRDSPSPSPEHHDAQDDEKDDQTDRETPPPDPSVPESEVEDEDEIEILNESQTSLFATIYKNVHKVDPKMEIREESVDSPTISSPCMSPSLLADEDEQMEDQEFVDEDADLIISIVKEIRGADDNMVRNAIRVVKSRNDVDKVSRDSEGYDEVVEIVKNEVENKMVKIVSKLFNCSIRQVKICLAELNGDGKATVVSEEILGDAVKEKLAEEELVSLVETETRKSKEKIKESLNELKLCDFDMSSKSAKDMLLKKLQEKEDLEQLYASVADKHNVDETLSREVVTEVIKDNGEYIEKEVDALIGQRLGHKRKVESLMSDLGCSEHLALNALETALGNYDTAVAIVNEKVETHEKSKVLAEAFNVSVDFAKSKLEESGLNEDLASQAIQEESQNLFDDDHENDDHDMHDEEELPKEGIELNDEEPNLVRSKSPDFEDEELFEEYVKKNNNSIEPASSKITGENHSKKVDPIKLSKKKTPNEDDIDSLLDDEVETPDESSVPVPPVTTHKSFPPMPTNSLKKRTPHPSLSGPKLIDAPMMPQRKAYTRGISVDTADSLVRRQKQTETKPKPDMQGMFKPFSPYKPSLKPSSLKPSKPKEIIQEKALKSKEQLTLERKLKLKEVAEKNRKPEVEKTQSAPATKMKFSIPKNQKLLQDMQRSENVPIQPRKKVDKPKPLVREKEVTEPPEFQPPKTRERRPSGSDSGSKAVKERRGSEGGFLEQEATKLDKTKKEKYVRDSDGYRTLKKMSSANVDYNIMSQDISNMPVAAKPLKFSGIEPRPVEPPVKMSGRRRVTWRDSNGLEPLVDVKEIPSENKGLKPNQSNCKDFKQAPGQSSSSTTSTTSSVSNKGSSKPTLMDDIFKVILGDSSANGWNVPWLKEQKIKSSSEPPPVQGKWHLTTLPSTFSSCEEYTKIFIPLMLYELWASVTESYNEKAEGVDDLPVCLQEVTQEPGKPFGLVRCLGLLTEKEVRRDLGAEGVLVRVDLKLGVDKEPGKKLNKCCFGYVQQARRLAYPVRGGEMLGEMDMERVHQLERLAEKAGRKHQLKHLVIYTIKTKMVLWGPGQSLCAEKHTYIHAITRIKSDLRKFEALLALSQSKLCQDLISPSPRSLTYSAGLGSEHLHATIKDLPQLAKLNRTQKRTIVSIGRAVGLDHESPRVCLVQGPPGTGKSSTITGLILQVLYSKLEVGRLDSMPRILVVAPSNAAVDELTLKLLDVRRQLPEKTRFRLLRLGVEKAMQTEVQKYTFDANVKRIVEEDTRKLKATESLEKDQKSKQLAANQIYENKKAAEEAGDTDLAAKLNRDFKEKMDQINKVKAELRRPLDFKSQREMKKAAEDRIMAGADLLLTTLGSCMSKEVDKYLMMGVGTVRSAGSMRPISVCIMDEASQCVEPEALIPLRLGFSKLVLVGDHEQLPATVVSRKAAQLDYHQSLFSRLVSTLSPGLESGSTSSAGNTPPKVARGVFQLDIQYRMHPGVADWPAKYFYGGRLEAGGQERSCPLAPYTVLHLDSREVQEGGQCWNKGEVGLVGSVLRTVRDLVGERMNIGVITFYAKQKQNISLEVQNSKMPLVEVNTVDGFQGSERDIIIISCVRAGSGNIGFLKHKERLNVALTRARYSLVVVGNMDYLAEASPRLWGELVTNARERKAVFNVDSKTDLKRILEVGRGAV